MDNDKVLPCDLDSCSGTLELCKATIKIEQLTIVDIPVYVCNTCKRRKLTNDAILGIKNIMLVYLGKVLIKKMEQAKV